MSILIWIIFGGLAGWIASMITGDNERQGILGNIVVGILGALLGGWLSGFFGASGVTGFNLTSLIIAIGGAVILLFIVRTFRGGHPHNR